MIVGGYVLDLYCECAECCQNRERRGHVITSLDPAGFQQFNGNSKRDAMRNARRVGWRISRHGQAAFAPGHRGQTT